MEIGGFFELENGGGREYHEGLIRLNSARNALRYLIRLYSIKRLVLPYYMCDSVFDTCTAENVEMVYYGIDEKMKPQLDGVTAEDWVYIADFYGSLAHSEIQAYQKAYPRLIIDCTQSFYKKMKDSRINALYSCRKFFGVPDGAYLQLSSDAAPAEIKPEQDCSAHRLEHIAGRREKGSQQYYQAYRSVEDEIAAMPLKTMSETTKTLLRSIDYDKASEIRRENYRYVEKRLSEYNKLKLTVEGTPFSYPFLTEKGAELRRFLIGKKIFIPTLWENVAEAFPYRWEAELSRKLCSLPIDQRYSLEEMKFMCDVIVQFIKENC